MPSVSVAARKPSKSTRSPSCTKENLERSAGADGKTQMRAGAWGISAAGTISRTCWNAQRLKGAVRQLASVTWPSGGAGKAVINGTGSIPARVDDDREILHRRFDQLFRSVARGRVEEQRIARLHEITAVGVQVSHLSGQHVDELDAAVTKIRVRHGVLAQGDQVRLHRDLARQRMPEQIVEVARLGPAPLDPHAAARLHERTIAPLLGLGEQGADRHVERLGERLEGGERRRDRAVFDLRQHSGGNAGGEAQLRS